MYAAILIENALLFAATGYALCRDRNTAFLILFLANMIYMVFDYELTNCFNLTNADDNFNYYILNSAFFLIMFSVFFSVKTRIRCRLSACMIIQSAACLVIAANGASFNSYVLFDSVVVYYAVDAVFYAVWCAEIFILLSDEILFLYNSLAMKFKHAIGWW